MFILFGIILAIATIVMLVIAIKNSKGAFRKYIIIVNAALVLMYGVLVLVNYNDVIAEDEEAADYYISKGVLFSEILYDGQIDGYECVRFTSLDVDDCYVVPQDMVEVSGFSKVYKPCKVYSRHNESFITGKTMIELSNGKKAYYSENIVMIKPDLSDLVLFSGVFGGGFLVTNDIVCGIITLVKKRKNGIMR